MFAFVKSTKDGIISSIGKYYHHLYIKYIIIFFDIGYLALNLDNISSTVMKYLFEKSIKSSNFNF